MQMPDIQMFTLDACVERTSQTETTAETEGGFLGFILTPWGRRWKEASPLPTPGPWRHGRPS